MSEQSKAGVYLSFAEKQAAKLPDGSEPPAFAVRTCAIVGAGTMGIGIAMTCANAGIRTTLVDLLPAPLERAGRTIAANYAASQKKGRLTQGEVDERLGRIAYAASYDVAAEVDLVIEAVFEEMDVKQSVFALLDAIAPHGTILATNTSSLDVDAIAAATRRPEHVVGMHFFSPAHVMRLLEVVRGAKASWETLGLAIAIAKQLGKIPVVAGNGDGFIGNRMIAAYRREAEFLLEEGASPQQVDAALERFGLAMGPFAMLDLAGLDIGWRIRKRRYAQNPPRGRTSRIADHLCEHGRFGQKTLAGFFRYEEGSRVPIPDPYVDGVIAECACASGIARRAIADDEIVERCLYALVNEGARVLDEGIAARPGDIDVVYCYGYGFPASRGGPMYWADGVGLAAIHDRILQFRDTFGDVWEPAPLLRDLATRGGTFAQWPSQAVRV